MNNEIFETVDTIVDGVMGMVEAADMDENEFLATVGTLMKVYSVKKGVDIADITSKLFIGIAQTEGELLRKANN